MQLRHLLLTAAAAGTAAALASTAPTMAKGIFDADNAHKVDGLHASQLTKTQFYASDTDFNDFTGCTPTVLLSRSFKAPHAGVVSVVGSVNAARDASSANGGVLTARILIDGTRAGIDVSVNPSQVGVRDSSLTAIGARKLGKGTHTIAIEGEECADGVAFILGEAMTVSYSAFGTAPASPPPGT